MIGVGGGRDRLARLVDVALDSAEEMIRKRVLVAVLGLAGHAAYFYWWTVIQPQPYEAPGLRAALGAMFLALLLPAHWIHRLGAVWPAYWQLTVMLNLPFFFTYMALRNDTWVWAASLEGALLMVYLMTSGALTFLLILMGVALGALCAASFGIDWETNCVIQAAPVLIFALVAAAVLNRKKEQHSRSKTAALLSYAGYIAHELRTPLASIAVRASLTRGCPMTVGEEGQAHLEELSQEVKRSFALIDMLLTNVDPLRHVALKRAGSDPADGDALISEIVAQALRRYPFRSEAERERVRVEVLQDCKVKGPSLLLQHVLMNLVRNAFEHGRRGHAVELGITARRSGKGCEVSVQDNGQGCAPDELHHGGLGLLFCRSVLRSVGGELKMMSNAGGGCTVRLCLPSAD